jgi:pimeloyl-ACP methyl ester carboxylesterase
MFQLYYRAMAHYYTKDPRWPEMMDRDLSKTTLESFLFSIASLRKTDLRSELGAITVPAMGMYGDKDIVVHPEQWKPMLAGIEHARIERFHNAGHFIMLDEPQRFTEILKDFLDAQPITTPIGASN